jgi:hypothetical protein
MLNVAGREMDFYKKLAGLQIIFIIVSMIQTYALCSYSNGMYEIFIFVPAKFEVKTIMTTRRCISTITPPTSWCIGNALHLCSEVLSSNLGRNAGYPD